MTDHTQPSNSSTVYECQACGWVYPPQTKEQVSPADNTVISAKDTLTPFSQLSSSFVCPLCGVPKSEFKAIETTSLQTQADVDASDAPADTVDALADHPPQAAKIVIIGAGLAGWGVVDAVRSKDKDISMTLITADEGDRYHKPMLSAAFSQKKSAEDLIRFTGQDASQTANIQLLANTSVNSIDSDKRIVYTDKGNVQYDDLVIAMGATPAMPPSLANLPDDVVRHINDITNFAKIQCVLAEGTKHVAVIGAGMVGTEIAEDLTKAGHQITLFDMNDAPLATMLPPIATTKIKDALTAQGIEFVGGSRVTDVFQNADVSQNADVANANTAMGEAGLTLQFVDAGNKKQTLKVDHILVSTGLKVDSTLAASAGIEFDARTGIAVNEATLQTSQPHIYAIGDCMSINDTACRYVAPLRMQAATIAEHILGTRQDNYEHKPYQHKPPMIRLKNKSISVSATGTPTADESYGIWQIVSESQSDTHNEMVLQQVANNEDVEDVVATVTLKMPN